MKIDGKELADIIITHTATQVKSLKTAPKLIDFCVMPGPVDELFIGMKAKICERAGIEFSKICYDTAPKYLKFVKDITQISKDENVSGIILQLPLPVLLSPATLVKSIPPKKDIEAKNKKSPHDEPIALACLTVLKQIFLTNSKTPQDVIFNPKTDNTPLKKAIRNKKLVLLGKGETGGGPIGNYFAKYNISYLGINSKTPQAELHIREADIIISAVGKKVIFPKGLKQGVVLLSVGLRKEGEHWVGDYDEDEIKDIASYYTPTPGGVGPIDVAYVAYNTYQSAII